MICALSGGLMLPPRHPGIEMAKTALRMQNPAWIRAKRRGARYKLPPPYVEGCHPIPDGPWKGGLMVPRVGADELLGVDLGQVVDRRTLPLAERLTLSASRTPRDYQAECKRRWLEAGGSGVVTVPCGGGKTVIGMDVISSLDTPALVLVHTKALLKQWVGNLGDHLGVKATVIRTGKKSRTGRICIATIQTLTRWPFSELLEWAKGFGLVVVDEAHHVPAQTWGRVMLAIPARYRLLLTATPDRQDHLEQILFWHGGPIVAEITQKRLLDEGVVVPAHVSRINTGVDPDPLEEAEFDLPEDEDGDEDGDEDKKQTPWDQILKTLLSDEGRNRLIVERVCRRVQEGHQVLVLTESKAHGELIAEMARHEGYKSRVIHADLTVNDRDGRLAAALTGELRVIVATQLADEGLDLPSLSALILTCPGRGGGRLRQRVGRVSRAAPGKGCSVVDDLVDRGFLEKLWWSRQETYERLLSRIYS